MARPSALGAGASTSSLAAVGQLADGSAQAAARLAASKGELGAHAGLGEQWAARPAHRVGSAARGLARLSTTIGSRSSRPRQSAAAAASAARPTASPRPRPRRRAPRVRRPARSRPRRGRAARRISPRPPRVRRRRRRSGRAGRPRGCRPRARRPVRAASRWRPRSRAGCRLPSRRSEPRPRRRVAPGQLGGEGRATTVVPQPRARPKTATTGLSAAGAVRVSGRAGWAGSAARRRRPPAPPRSGAARASGRLHGGAARHLEALGERAQR